MDKEINQNTKLRYTGIMTTMNAWRKYKWKKA